MAISTDYPRPITVNGFVCRNCDEVSDAKRFIDPASPAGLAAVPGADNGAVSFGGSLESRNAGSGFGSDERPRQFVDRLA
tara:strand:- start:15952 stop:16191 length:240 start_codon:yes stop_codon:yes gene_type:complete